MATTGRGPDHDSNFFLERDGLPCRCDATIVAPPRNIATQPARPRVRLTRSRQTAKNGATLMTGRLPEPPRAAPGGMLEHPRIYTEFEPPRLLRIGLRNSVFKLLLSVALTA